MLIALGGGVVAVLADLLGEALGEDEFPADEGG